jgi:enoyl-CoA hydratase/carnithine racemase
VPVGAPTLVVVGDLDQATPAELATLTRLPVIVAARSPAGPAAARAVDVVVDDEAALEQTRRGCERAPIAATAAALLLRSPTADWWEGLVRESATYSMLQGGEEFQRWHRARGTRTGSGDAHPRVRVERHGATTEVTLTRPERHNALDAQTRDELHAALAEATTGSGPVVLLGAGPSFCSGGDLDEFGTFPDPASAHLLRLTRSVAAIIAAAADRFVVGLHGACLGAGVELPAFAGHVVAADDARVGLPELGLGLVPGAGGTVSLPARIGRHRTFELLALDGTISASAAREWGLVDELVPRARLRSRCLEIAESLS